MKGKERTILVVDDEESVRSSLAAVLEREGYTVLQAAGGEEGLVILKDRPVQLVFSDHNMPGMTGIEFLKLVRERYPNVVRIMLTGEPDPQIIIRSINQGEVYRFLKKPWDNTLLRVTVYFAFESIQLADENRRLVAALRRQIGFLREMEREFPYLAAQTRDDEAAQLLAQADLVRSSGS